MLRTVHVCQDLHGLGTDCLVRCCCVLPCLQAFAAWQEGVARLRGAKRFQQHAARRVQAVLLRYAFASWAAHAADLRTARAAAEAMHTSSSRALLHDAFHSWRALRQTLASARSKAASWAAIQDVKQLRGAWEGWLARVDRARELARAAQAMCDRRERGVLPAVLRAWAAAAGGGMARTRRLQRSALAHLVLRRCLATQRRFFKVGHEPHTHLPATLRTLRQQKAFPVPALMGCVLLQCKDAGR